MSKKNTFLIITFILILSSGVLFSYVRPVYYLMQFKPDNTTNYTLFGKFTNILVEEFSSRNYILLDGFNPGEYGEQADYLLNGLLSFQGDRYLIVLRSENVTNQKDRWEDTVYTFDLLSEQGFREASQALAVRMDVFRKGRTPEAYRERTDFEKKYGRAFVSGFNRKLDHMEIFQLFNVQAAYPYGYDFGLPIKFGLDFFEYDYIWAIPPTTFGIGVGAKVFSYKGTNAMAFLPVQVYVPIFIFPDDYDFNRKDLYFVAEAGFFIPQASYFDLSLRLIFNGISISLGWLYLPHYSNGTNSRAEYNTFYGGITFSFGQYRVKWQ